MKLDRRSFLKTIGVTSAGLVLPSFDIVFPKAEIVPAFRMRAVIGYDIKLDEELIRYDVFDGKTQLHVGMCVDNICRNDPKEFIKRIHRPMVRKMKGFLRHKRIPILKLKPLPYPPGYKNPEWFSEILYG